MTDRDWALANAIRSARMKKGYTQEQLSELLEITPGHLKHMESGKRKPSVPLLFQMMELLHFSADELVFPDREKKPVLYLDGFTDEAVAALTRFLDEVKK